MKYIGIKIFTTCLISTCVYILINCQSILGQLEQNDKTADLVQSLEQTSKQTNIFCLGQWIHTAVDQMVEYDEILAENIPPENQQEQSDLVTDHTKILSSQTINSHIRILLVGDSLMEQLFLSSEHYNDPDLVFFSIAKHSTGLANGLYFNWPLKLKEGLKKYHPDVVVILLGANDLRSISYNNIHESYLNDVWASTYQKIASDIITNIVNVGAIPVWLSLPPMGADSMEGIDDINQLQKIACQSNDKCLYIDTTSLLSDETGQFQAFKTFSDGHIERIRRKDRVHMTNEGAMIVLSYMMPEVKKTFIKNKQNEK